MRIYGYALRFLVFRTSACFAYFSSFIFSNFNFISVNDFFFFACVKKQSIVGFLFLWFSCKLIIVMFGTILNFDRFTSCVCGCKSLFVCVLFFSTCAVLFLPPKLVSSSSFYLFKTIKRWTLSKTPTSFQKVLQTRVCLLCAKHVLILPSVCVSNCLNFALPRDVFCLL